MFPLFSRPLSNFSRSPFSRRTFCSFPNLVKGALNVLQTPDPNEKAKLARKVAREYYDQSSDRMNEDIASIQDQLPIQPSLPENIISVSPNRIGSPKESL